MSDELHYLVDEPQLSINEIQRFAQDVWRDAKKMGSGVRREATELGIQPDALPAEIGEIISMRSEGASVGAVDMFSLVVGVIGGGTGRVAFDIWKQILLPRLVARYGPKAIKASEPNPTGGSASTGNASSAKASDSKNPGGGSGT